jgi:hypothetical protein
MPQHERDSEAILRSCALVQGRVKQLRVTEKKPGVSSRRNLQRLIVALAAVPITTGAVSLVFGTAAIPDAGAPSASTESELHFYAVWWLGAGLFLASLAPRIEHRGRALQAVCALLVLGAVGRVLAIADAGWPQPIFVVLMALEFLLPPVLVVWQARVAHASRG